MSDTFQEQIASEKFTFLLNEKGIVLQQGKNPYDLLEALIGGINCKDFPLLAEIYSSFDTLGAESPFFQQALQQEQKEAAKEV